MNCQLVHLLLFIEGYLMDCIFPLVSNYKKISLWPLIWTKKKKNNFKSNIVEMCVLIKTVITTKYPDSADEGGYTVWKISAAVK